MHKYIALVAFVLFPFLFAFAATVPPADLVKVSPESTSKCVEYYIYQGEMYCSTKAEHTTPIDPNLINKERLLIMFDERPWQAVWGKEAKDISTIEYIPKGADINNWNELITSQFIPGIQNKVTPKQFADIIIDNLKKTGFNTAVHFLEESPNRVIFEFQIKSPPNQIQDEIQMITRDDKGMYVLHYVVKKADMGKENREKWLTNLKKSSIR